MDLREARAGVPRHPWELARADFVTGLVGEHAPRGRPVDVLDIGAGDGYLAARLLGSLARGSRVTCVDSGYDAAWLRSASPGEAVEFRNEPPDGPFDWVLMLDVLEHVPDEQVLLEVAASRLPPGGHLLVTVPAYSALYTVHDRELGHYRRYSAAQLKRLFGNSWRLRDSGSFFTSLLMPRSLTKLAELARGQRTRPDPEALATEVRTALSDWSLGPAPTALIRGVLRWDARLGRRVSRAGIPVPGLSTWALVERA